MKGSQWDNVIININIAVMDENPLNKKLFFIIECYIINIEGKIELGKKIHHSATTIVISDLGKNH